MVEADNDKSTGGNAFSIIMGKSVINLYCSWMRMYVCWSLPVVILLMGITK